MAGSRDEDQEWRTEILRGVSAENRPPDHLLPPRRIFRFIGEAVFADDFCQGKVFLSTLSRCRAFENAARGDAGEAQHTYRVNAVQGSTPEDAFQAMTRRIGIVSDPGNQVIVIDGTGISRVDDGLVLCCTSDFSGELVKDFGQHCVEIGDSWAFACALTDALEKVLPIEWWGIAPVQYRPRSFINAERDVAPVGFVKPEHYASQREVRILWRLRSDAEVKPLVVDAPAVAKLCRRIA